MRALTEQTYIDELEVEDEGIAELMMDDNAIADVASKYMYTYMYTVLTTCIGPGTYILLLYRAWYISETAHHWQGN